MEIAVTLFKHSSNVRATGRVLNNIQKQVPLISVSVKIEPKPIEMINGFDSPRLMENRIPAIIITVHFRSRFKPQLTIDFMFVDMKQTARIPFVLREAGQFISGFKNLLVTCREYDFAQPPSIGGERHPSWNHTSHKPRLTDITTGFIRQRRTIPFFSDVKPRGCPHFEGCERLGITVNERITYEF